MAGIFVGLLMILFISGRTTADEQIKVSSTLTESIVEWGMNIYSKLNSYKNVDEFRKNIKFIMNQVQEASSKLDALDAKLDLKLDTIINTLFFDNRLGNSLHRINRQLRRGFAKIDHYFDQSREYKYGGSYGNDTLSSFANKALWNDGSVSDLLDDMYQAVFPNNTVDSTFLSAIHQHSLLNALQLCDTYISDQQKIYYIYIHLIITEIKGLLTQQHCLNINHLFDNIPTTYQVELNRAKDKFEKRVSEYYKLFSELITRIPKHLRRCEANSPQRDVHFLELNKFSRLSFLDARVVMNDGCHTCPEESKLRDESLRTNTTIYNCKEMGTSVIACPASSSDSHREYLWWKDEKHNHYGPYTSCAKRKLISGICKVCVCSTDMNKIKSDDNSTIWRISVTEQTSDIMNNKVVTGVRFVTYDNALHLQIQQAQFSHSGMIYNVSEWKELNIDNQCTDRNEVFKMRYEPLRHDRKSLYLDDIKVPGSYVVTGVRFQLVENSAFRLQILATQFDLRSGNLLPYTNVWLDASTSPMRPEDYKRKRIEIHMDTPDDPTKTSQFQYDLQSNKLIKFTHTDIYKDGGQTTIPLLDAQSVVTQPSFPLGGIGLSFRGKNGFGGYIAPHIYTLDIIDHIKSLEIHSAIVENSSTTEKVEHEISTELPFTAINKHKNVEPKNQFRSCVMNNQPHVIQV